MIHIFINPILTVYEGITGNLNEYKGIISSLRGQYITEFNFKPNFKQICSRK